MEKVNDYLGRPLSVGDHVVRIHRTDSSAFFEKCVVIGFTGGNSRTKVELQTKSVYHSKTVREWPSKIIKIDVIGGKNESP